jgi:hypothetical protein
LSLPIRTNDSTKLEWQSVAGKTYFLERSADLSLQPPFSTLKNEIAGQADTTTYIDTNAVGTGPYFYRIGVHP